MRRLSIAALAAVVIVGCGHPPDGGSPTLGVANGTPPTRHSQTWALAGKEASAIGPIKAEVVEWKVEKPKIQSLLSEPMIAEQEMLVVVVRFSTDDDTVKKDVLPPIVAPHTAVDEFGNSYSILNSQFTPVGEREYASIAVTKGHPVSRTVLIEKPIPKATRIELSLSGFMCDSNSKEFFRFAVPLPPTESN